jgi:hypothetical protein
MRVGKGIGLKEDDSKKHGPTFFHLRPKQLIFYFEAKSLPYPAGPSVNLVDPHGKQTWALLNSKNRIKYKKK